MTHVERVSVVGLGKLGACLAACLAEGDFHVVGVDRDPRVVDDISRGRAPVVEPGLSELIGRNGGRLLATTDTSRAVRESDLTFIVVPTPTRPLGART